MYLKTGRTKKISVIIKSFGPGFIIASVVLGPGSITVSSSIGSVQGYSFLWLIVIAAISMAVYTAMGARFGVLHDETILKAIASTYGRWFSISIGISAFIASASFQFGNNLGIGIGMEGITGLDENIWPVVFSGLAIGLIFFAKNIYKTLEKLMMVMIMIMIIAFLVNLVFAAPQVTSVAKGFIPDLSSFKHFDKMAALVATSFVLSSALYQSYLVQQKGWKKENLKDGLRDTYTGVFLLALISALIIITSAAVLHPRGIEVKNVADMAMQLETLFGGFSKYIFSAGLCAAAFSSLVVNPVIGAGLLSDSLSIGKTMDQRGPKIIALSILLAGMIIAMFFRGDIIYALIIAQAATLMGVPLIAVAMFLLANNNKIMGEYKNTKTQNAFAVLGLVLITSMVYFMYHKLISFISMV